MIQPIDAKLTEAFTGFLSTAESVIIGTHLNPDGDAFGSALAVSHYLDGLSIPNEVVSHHPARKNLRFLPGIARVLHEPTRPHRLGIVVDLDSPERLGRTEPFFNACEHVIVIDHHVPHNAPGDLRIVDPDAPATALILTRLFQSIGAKVTPAMATCLFTGLTTDTGSFRYRNTNPEAFAVGGFLLDQGADLELISQEVWMNRPLSSTLLLGHLLENMHLEADDQIAWGLARYDDFVRFEASDEDTEGFVNELLAVDTVQIAAFAREQKPGRIRVSLRSRKGFDVAEAAREFGGGGHVNAAGLSFLEADPDESMVKLVEALKRCLESR